MYAQADIKDGLEMDNDLILKRIQAQNYLFATNCQILHKQLDKAGVYTEVFFMIDRDSAEKLFNNKWYIGWMASQRCQG